jgi:hypothetical protein
MEKISRLNYIFEEQLEDPKAQPQKFKGYLDQTYCAGPSPSGESTANYAIMIYNVSIPRSNSLGRRRRMSSRSCRLKSTSSLRKVDIMRSSVL